MKTKINRDIFTQTRFQSNVLSQLGFIVHQYKESGRYQADVSRHGKPMYSFQIDVCKNHKKPQFSADLAALDKSIRGGNERSAAKECCCEPHDSVFELLEGGFGLFYVGSGSGGYSVCTYPIDQKPHTVFDSTALGDGDMFGITLLRPGQYVFLEHNKNIKAAIEVEEVKPGKTRYVPPDPVYVNSQQLQKSKVIKLRAAQGLIYKASGGESITIELLQPNDDDSENPELKIAHWNKPSGGSLNGLKAK